MDSNEMLQDLKDDCRSVGWDGYIPAIEALESERDALRAEVERLRSAHVLSEAERESMLKTMAHTPQEKADAAE